MTLHYYILGGVILSGIIALIPVFYVLAPIYPWTYSNARVKTMHKKMIKDQDIEGYILRPYEDIIYDLEEKFIPNFSKYLSANFTYAAVDNALRQHYIQTVKKLIRITPNQQNDFLQTYLTRFDIRTIKNVVRSISNKNNQDLFLTNTTLFSEGFKNKDTYTLQNIEKELQGTPYQKTLEKHKSSLKEQEYTDFEMDLNRVYLDKMRRAASSKYAKRFVKKNIDKLNLQTWVKNGENYVEGGYIQISDYQKDSYTALKEAYTKKGITLPSNKEDAETHMRKQLLTYAKKLQSQDPHSEASTISYLIKKAYAVQQLNILLKLKYHNTSEQKIREALNI